MLLIVGTFRLLGGNLDVVRPAIARMVNASRKDPGCLAYFYSEDILESGLIHVKELWRDQEALDDHFATGHSMEWREEWFSPRIHDRNLQVFTVDDPIEI